MMRRAVEGIVPVMLTPMDNGGAIDWEGLENLVDWYIEHRSDALFAVCQSSEMQRLTLDERVALSKRVVELAGSKLPVISSGHISTDLDEQIAELKAVADTGVDALVLVTNRLDPDNKGTDAFRAHLDALLAALPSDMPLGLYECPAPYRRLLSDDEFKLCRDSGRFVVLKDVSCDLETVQRRVALAEDSPLAVINANAAIAFDAMRSGSKGFSGVFTNFHPDLYAELYARRTEHGGEIEELKVFLALAAMAEPMGYPKLAKLYHNRLGTFAEPGSRVVQYDVEETHWAAGVLLDHIQEGTEYWRERLHASRNK